MRHAVKALAFAAALLLAVPAPAAEPGAPTPLTPGSKAKGAKRVTRAVIGRISRDDCRRLIVAHAPDPGVKYQPGRDVYGRRVKPADLPGGPRIALPRVFRIRFSVDLETYLGIAPQPGIDPDVMLGQLTVRGNRVYFNGQPLDDPYRSFIVDQCRRRLRRAR
jgi:hypothetical protein